MNGFSKVVLIFLCVFFLSPANARSQEHKHPEVTTSSEKTSDKKQRPLKVMSVSEWAGLSEKEQGLLIMGVLEGWSFDLFNQSHPRLKLLVDCVEREGIGRFVNEVNEILIAKPDEGKFPAPWWISQSLRTVCRKYEKE